MKKFIIAIILTLTLVQTAPVYAVLDYSGLVQCDGVTTDSEKGRQKVCNFQALINMANYIIKWIFRLTIPIFVALIAYAGFLYMTPKEENRKTASKMLWAGVWGFVIMLCAWFIVTTILGWVLDKSFKGAANSLLENK